jgi:hypothetical protein
MSTTLKQRAVRVANLFGWRSDAQNAYFDMGRATGRLIDELVREFDAAERADIFRHLAATARTMANAYPEAFGPDPNPDEGGRDLSESFRLSGVLYELLTDVEFAVAAGGPRTWTETELESVAGETLDAMTRIPNVVERTAAARDVLYLNVVDTVGGQAAEVLACLPVPGVDTRTLRGIIRNARNH